MDLTKARIQNALASLVPRAEVQEEPSPYLYVPTSIFFNEKTHQNRGPHVTCQPLSYNDFLHRLGTYSLATWFAKPPELSPLICSQYGWKNISLDTLECSTCLRKLKCSSDEPYLAPGLSFVSVFFFSHSYFFLFPLFVFVFWFFCFSYF